MSKLKRLFPLSAPAREDATLLPAALCAVLAAMLGSQLMLSSPVEVPTPVLRASPIPALAAELSAVPARANDNVVLHNLFAPGRSQIGVVGKVPGIALGGLVVAGTMGRGATMRAVIVKPGGIVVMLSPGGLMNGWQLVRLLSDHAEFRRGSSKLDMPYGGALPQAIDAGAGTGERTD